MKVYIVTYVNMVDNLIKVENKLFNNLEDAERKASLYAREVFDESFDTTDMTEDEADDAFYKFCIENANEDVFSFGNKKITIKVEHIL